MQWSLSLSQVSREDEQFSFIGFLPKVQSQIEDLIMQYESKDVVFYESPNRVLNTLKTIKNVRPDAKVAVGRELTKVFEEVVVDNVANAIDYFEKMFLKENLSALFSEVIKIQQKQIWNRK